MASPQNIPHGTHHLHVRPYHPESDHQTHHIPSATYRSNRLPCYMNYRFAAWRENLGSRRRCGFAAIVACSRNRNVDSSLIRNGVRRSWDRKPVCGGCLVCYFGSLTQQFFSFSQGRLVSLAASTQALITLGSPSSPYSPEQPEQPEQSLSSP
jgi:hypothetical protein